MLEVSKVVFVAFTQHCIQSNATHVTHVRDVDSVLYSVYSSLSPNTANVGKSKFHLIWSFFGKIPFGPSVLGV